jgi:hypothetical protein
MIGRRLVALLCVLLAHALMVYSLLSQLQAARTGPTAAEFEAAPISVYPVPPSELAADAPPFEFEFITPAPVLPQPDLAPLDSPPGESNAITSTENVDWPLEGKKAAARVLAREAEAERIARMFAGPGGTWASLTKRQRSKLNRFRFKDGVDGLEYDEEGNQILRISDGCMIVNSGFIACKIGKVRVRGDMFENMREYFDELRLPETGEGNGTEPEALRPPY